MTFLYHYLPVVPLLAIALGWGLEQRRALAERRDLETTAVLGLALAVFLFTLPLLVGFSVSDSYRDVVRSWVGVFHM